MPDDHSATALNCYADLLNSYLKGIIQIPNLDRIAFEGILFRNAFVTDVPCALSRVTILAGKHTHLHGVKDNSTQRFWISLELKSTPRCKVAVYARCFKANRQWIAPMDWRKAFYYRYCEYPQPHRVLSHYGVRTERYKLVHYPTMNGWGLFDLQVDPREVRNFYNAPAYTGFVTELKALLTKLKAEVSDAG